MKSREEIWDIYEEILRSGDKFTEDNRESMIVGLVLSALLDIRDQNDELIRIAE